MSWTCRFARPFWSGSWPPVYFSESWIPVVLVKPHILCSCSFYTSKVLRSTWNLPLKRTNPAIQSCDSYRWIFTSSSCYNGDSELTEKDLAPRVNYFQQLRHKDRQTFILAINAYSSTDKLKRGHMEFIYAALKSMPDFGVERDIEVYKKIMDVFPKGKMIAKNMIQAEFMHFPRQQDCALFLLSKMEENDLHPDDEMKELVINIFGRSSLVFKKIARALYWGPKLKNISPYVLPDPLPNDAEKLAHLAIKRMSVDLRSQITHYTAEELVDSMDKTWIVSSQSPDQMKLINEHTVEQPLFVEGSYIIWLKRIAISYFILRAAPKSNSKPVVEDDLDDVSDLSLHMFGLPKPPGDLVHSPTTVHEQEDGTIMAMCATGTSSKDSLLSWIRFLQRTNPKLSEIPVLFTLRSPPTAVTTVNIRPENFSRSTETPILQKAQECKGN